MKPSSAHLRPGKARAKIAAQAPNPNAGIKTTLAYPSQSSSQPLLSNETARNISCSPSSALKKIEFRLAAFKAKTVQLAADFTNWHKAPIRMARNSVGVWEARVCLAPGKYRYRYLVDADVPRQSERAKQLPLPFSFGTLYGELEVR